MINSGGKLECCFFDAWGNKFTKLAEISDKVGHAVLIIQLAKVTYYNGNCVKYLHFSVIFVCMLLSVIYIINNADKPSVTNAMWSTKLYINEDLPEILAFKQR